MVVREVLLMHIYNSAVWHRAHGSIISSGVDCPGSAPTFLKVQHFRVQCYTMNALIIASTLRRTNYHHDLSDNEGGAKTKRPATDPSTERSRSMTSLAADLIVCAAVVLEKIGSDIYLRVCDVRFIAC